MDEEGGAGWTLLGRELGCCRRTYYLSPIHPTIPLLFLSCGERSSFIFETGMNDLASIKGTPEILLRARLKLLDNMILEHLCSELFLG